MTCPLAGDNWKKMLEKELRKLGWFFCDVQKRIYSPTLEREQNDDDDDDDDTVKDGKPTQ